LLDRTLDLDPAEREAFLARLAREQPADARELAALLAAEPELDAARFLCRAPVRHPEQSEGPWSESPDARPAPRSG
jgi:hypothetical protein